jgi:hypothetical protein
MDRKPGEAPGDGEQVDCKGKKSRHHGKERG